MCDQHCIEFVTTALAAEHLTGRRVLEVGSLDLNGSVRPALMAKGRPAEYVGVDIEEGPGVDLVCDVSNLAARFGHDAFDVVISTEMLEHVPDWRLAVDNIKRVLRPGGFVCLTTRRRAFPYHDYPHDHWRFETTDLKAIFADFDEVEAVELPKNGVGLCARKPATARAPVDYAAVDVFAMTSPTTPPHTTDEARWLHVEIGQRDRTIAWLHGEVAHRDQTVSWLHGEVARRDGALASLGASLEGTAAAPPAQPTTSSGPDLATLATIYGTDKLEHGYLPHYAHHFERLCDTAANVLEIGIRKGASLRMWRDFFTAATIHGLDIQDCGPLAEARIRIHRGDQADAELLRAIAEQATPLDVVIDDGSHMNRDVLASFAVLFPLLRPGGLYVIEDVHTSYWSKYGGEHCDLNTGRTSTSLVKNLLDGLNAHWIPGRALQPLDTLVDGIHCYPKLVFVSRGVNAGVLRPYDVRMMRETLAGRRGDGDPP